MPTQPTTVVNITRGAAFDIYIGRSGKGRRGPWGNPFIIGTDGTRAEVIAKYARWIAGQPQLLVRLPELQGKRLGCFCAPGSFMRRNLTMQDEDRWSADKVNLLITWWPHFGTYYMAEQLGLPRPDVQRRAETLGLHRLPRERRLCVRCRTAFQSGRGRLLCRDCYLLRRKEIRRAQPRTLEQWISDAVTVARYRSPSSCDLTVDYMIQLWYEQGGCCYYSGRQLVPPKYKRGREPLSASIDRLVPALGYRIGNVVWAAWVCNAGKSDLSVEDYVQLCAEVVRHCWPPVARWTFVCGGRCPRSAK